MMKISQSVAIVDDSDASRESFGYTVEDADLEPVPATGPLGEFEAFGNWLSRADFVLSDYELRAKNYANFTGAQVVAARQQAGQPSVLCTKYEKPQIDQIRPYRRWIPALLSPEELNPDSLLIAIEQCSREINGIFLPEREPWRALVRFVEPDPGSPDRFFIELPSWDVRMLLPVVLSKLPDFIVARARPDFRCHAMVNLDSERYEDVYLDEWSIP